MISGTRTAGFGARPADTQVMQRGPGNITSDYNSGRVRESRKREKCEREGAYKKRTWQDDGDKNNVNTRVGNQFASVR